ncbi:MAG: glycoside hydrolase family 125 protein [Clostridiales bacterium]|nr:glycoside hydrolase family 125 protein [Clostridiales bacterium]
MQQLSDLLSVKCFVEEIRHRLNNETLEIGDVFERCFLSTLNTTLQQKEDGTTFVITGDIPAMWLRDSACQVKPYLFVAKREPAMAKMIEGVIRRQVNCVLLDPYANAFNECANGNCWDHDKTDMKPELWERKFEIDSLCFPVELAYLYWKNCGGEQIFDDRFLAAAKKIVSVFRTEQDHEGKSEYTLERFNCGFADTLSREGKGALVNSRAGLIWSGFRPSDDACVYGYLIPSNMFAAVILGYLSEIAEVIYRDDAFAAETLAFSRELRTAIEKNAVVRPDDKRFFKPFYAYEVDGFGQYLIMDDANLPSLLSMPYFGYCGPEDELYKNTKEIILSEQNPYYYSGKYAKGIGSFHTASNYVWHISMGMQGLVSESRETKRQIIKDMISIDGGTGWMHEGIDVNDPTKFTRPWFSWANAVFVELVLDYCGYKLIK